MDDGMEGSARRAPRWTIGHPVERNRMFARYRQMDIAIVGEAPPIETWIGGDAWLSQRGLGGDLPNARGTEQEFAVFVCNERPRVG
ncbi:hypothetical protein GS397_06600 [Sphingobium yanoikuyae]|uniref:Uncharacterized protein n=1 Tax=Sphingobium yanoikuyae TaxID=13690 RepID=A0A6P1GEX7_SPHYA|nr:hypothetical protein [Sphingobium yanoikuyae]QHD66753.1 hypothetical protein GS397_06600 [Sphingobium yanoikuyae]